MKIKLTRHAKIKIDQRNITLDDIKRIIQSTQLKESDKFDKSLIHFIGNIKGRFLRVTGRWENNEELLVISASYDRRLKRRSK